MNRVFLSFRAEDKKQVDGLRLLAANQKFEIEFYDESIRVPYKSTDADYIKKNIREKINRASVTVCLLNSETYTSTWVCWELEESIKHGNKIVLMGLPGVSGSLTLPSPVRDKNFKLYYWDIDYLTTLIG